MANDSSDPPVEPETRPDPRASGDAGASATADLLEGVSLLVSAARKAVLSLESRDVPPRAQPAAERVSAEELTLALKYGGSKILDLVGQIASDLGESTASRAARDHGNVRDAKQDGNRDSSKSSEEPSMGTGR